MANTTNRVNTAFSTLPFDQIDNVSSTFIADDFIGVADVADFVDASGVAVASQYPWVGSEVAGDSAANGVFIPGVEDHVGIYQLQTGATTPADGDIAALSFGSLAADDADGVLVLDGNGVYNAWVIRLPDSVNSKVEVGLAGQPVAAVNSSALDIVSLVFDPEDTVDLWLGQVNGAGVDVEDASDLTYVQNDWVLLEIAADDTSAKFRVTTEDSSDTLAIQATMPVVALRPFIAVEAIGAAEEVVDIDKFHMRYQRRQGPLGHGSDWLGS